MKSVHLAYTERKTVFYSSPCQFASVRLIAMAAVAPQHICYLCTRKFTDAAALKTHEQYSQLHQQNLDRQDGVIRQHKEEVISSVNRLRQQLHDAVSSSNPVTSSRAGAIETQLRQQIGEFSQAQEAIEYRRAGSDPAKQIRHAQAGTFRPTRHEMRCGRLHFEVPSGEGVNMYNWPVSADQAAVKLVQLQKVVMEKDAALKGFSDFMRSEAQDLLTPPSHNPQGNSKMEEWRLFCIKEKAIYNILNLCSGEIALRVNVWYPASEESKIIALLQKLNEGSQQGAFLTNEKQVKSVAPTYIRVNDFTEMTKDDDSRAFDVSDRALVTAMPGGKETIVSLAQDGNKKEYSKDEFRCLRKEMKRVIQKKDQEMIEFSFKMCEICDQSLSHCAAELEEYQKKYFEEKSNCLEEKNKAKDYEQKYLLEKWKAEKQEQNYLEEKAKAEEYREKYLTEKRNAEQHELNFLAEKGKAEAYHKMYLQLKEELALREQSEKTRRDSTEKEEKLDSQDSSGFRVNRREHKGWQEVIDTYGIPKYQEANPALLSVVTFPFIFGMMYGDVGHGTLLFLAGLWLCKNAESLRFTQPTLFMVRYMVVSLGFFAIYAGFMYNDFFSVGLQLFDSRWKDVGEGNYEPDYDVKNSGGRGPYPFGLDWAWHGSNNELLYVNSLKMKLSVLFGVLQMTVGVFLRWGNAFYEKNMTDFFCECVPMMIFMLCFFGWMDVMILYKWVHPIDNPPSIINSLICMAMGQKDLFPLWDGSVELAQTLMMYTVCAVPIMLLPKPLILLYQHNQSKKAGEGAFVAIEEHASNNHGHLVLFGQQAFLKHSLKS
eukprot:s3411_g3.t2